MKQVVYIASPDSQQIHVFQLNNIGKLTWLQTQAVPGQVQPMTISPDKRYLYVGVRPDFAIITYNIADDGKLTQIAIASLPGSPTHISTDLQGRFLFAASYSSNCVSISPINLQGIVKNPIQQIEYLQAPHSINVDPIKPLLWVPCLKEDCIRLFTVDLFGKLTVYQKQPLLAAAKNAGPRHMAFHPKHNIIYCINELDGTINVYNITNEEKYCLCQTVTIMPAGFTGIPWAADIHITPNGRHLYVSERSKSLLCIFSVSETGMKLSLIGHQATETQPRGFNIDQTGRYLIVAGQKSDHISIYCLCSLSGELTVLTRYPVGIGPMWVIIAKIGLC